MNVFNKAAWKVLVGIYVLGTVLVAQAQRPPLYVALLSIEDRLTHEKIDIISKLQKMCSDPEISAVLIRINSGGGEVGLAFSIGREIELCRRKKPVVAWVPEIAASVAYLAVAMCHEIIASSTAEVGSIGVVNELEQWSNIIIRGHTVAADKSVRVFCKGSTEDFFKLEGRPLEDNLLQETNDNSIAIHQAFIELALMHRPQLASKPYAEWAEAQIFSGRRAQVLGLVDTLGSFSQARASIVKLLIQRGIDAHVEDIILVE